MPSLAVSAPRPDSSPKGRLDRLLGDQPVAAKVPAIGLLFWVIKLITTGVGEAGSDFLGQVNVPLAAAVGVFGTALAFKLQFRAREYRAWTYWFTVLMVAVFGTMVADGLRDGAGISYGVTTAFFCVAVAVVFFAWRRSEGTLSIHSITTRRRELFYWSAVLSTFALGTAAGDWTAISLNLGFFGSAVLFGAVMAVIAIAWRVFNVNAVFTFWAAYVVTRPLGASLADGFSKPTDMTGLNMGDGVVTAIGLVAFALLVASLARTKRDIQDPAVLAAELAEEAVHAAERDAAHHHGAHAHAGAAAPPQPLPSET